MNNRGFSIIELAIVILISGIIVAALASAYNIYLNKYNFDQTNLRITEAEDALEEFFETNGRLPCAAPRNIPNTERAYGREVNCTANASGTVRVNGKGGKKVRIGLFPARTLGVSDIYMQDAYGNTLLYAVTESATDEDTYTTDGGAIDIVDGTKASLLKDVDYAQYVILSHGPNHNGAYSNAGVLINKCDKGKLESENCDDDAIFMDTLRAHADDANYYEDTIRYDYKLKGSGQYCPPTAFTLKLKIGNDTITGLEHAPGAHDGTHYLISVNDIINTYNSIWQNNVYCDNGKWTTEANGSSLYKFYHWRVVETVSTCNEDAVAYNTNKSNIIVKNCDISSNGFQCTGQRLNKGCAPKNKSYSISVTWKDLNLNSQKAFPPYL